VALRNSPAGVQTTVDPFRRAMCRRKSVLPLERFRYCLGTIQSRYNLRMRKRRYILNRTTSAGTAAVHSSTVTTSAITSALTFSTVQPPNSTRLDILNRYTSTIPFNLRTRVSSCASMSRCAAILRRSIAQESSKRQPRNSAESTGNFGATEALNKREQEMRNKTTRYFVMTSKHSSAD